MYVLLGRGLRSEKCFNFLLLRWDFRNISCFVSPMRVGAKKSHSNLEMWLVQMCQSSRATVFLCVRACVWKYFMPFSTFIPCIPSPQPLICYFFPCSFGHHFPWMTSVWLFRCGSCHGASQLPWLGFWGQRNQISPELQWGWKEGRWGDGSLWVCGWSVSVPVLVCSACRKSHCDIECAGLWYLCGSYKNLCKLNLWHSSLPPERKM